MSENEHMETRLYGRYWDDGVLDLVSGAALVLVGVLWFFDMAFLIGLMTIWPVFWFPLRRASAEPRAGYVEFSHQRKRRNLEGLIAGYIVFTAMALLAVGGGAHLYKTQGGDFVASFINGVPGVLASILALFATWITMARRFYVYTATLVISGLVTGLAQWEPEVPFLCAGVVVLAMGAMHLHHFIRDADAFEQAQQ
jgi:hypothetical protein